MQLHGFIWDRDSRLERERVVKCRGSLEKEETEKRLLFVLSRPLGSSRLIGLDSNRTDKVTDKTNIVLFFVNTSPRRQVLIVK